VKLLKDTWERALSTFVEAAVAALALAYQDGDPLSWDYALKLATCAGALAVFKGLAAGQIGDKTSAGVVKL